MLSSSEKSAANGLWLPKTPEDIFTVQDVLYETWNCRVVCPSPGVIIKWRGGNLAIEILSMRYARKLNLCLPVPAVLHHPPIPRKVTFNPFDDKNPTPASAWYICMERCPGVALDKVIDNMSPQELDHIADQLRSFLSQMAHVKSRTLGSVDGSPYCNFYFRFPFSPKHAFTSAGEFVDYFRELLLLFCTEKYTEDLLSHFPRNAPVHFTHGDLLPKNIVVSGSTITGIVDWATAGFYPSYWEYCMMHQQPYRTPGWDHVLRKVFPSERRTKEIWAVNRLVDVLEATF